MSRAERLHPDDVEAIARRVAELIAPPAAPALLTAAQVAVRFGVDRGWVYEHAVELGAVRLGDGPKPRLRFDPSRVAAALPRPGGLAGSTRDASRVVGESRPAARRQTARVATAGRDGAELLPIRQLEA
jgi:hypothetical protein